MKVIEVTRHGGPEVLAVKEKPVPEPGPGQVLVKTGAAGINFADLMSRAGTYPAAPPPPFTPGFETAGTVEQVGEGVSDLTPGDRVVALTRGGGGYAEYVVADAATTVKIPHELDFAPATALLVQGLTAYGLLAHAVPAMENKTVLVSAAAGGVGSLAVQLAKFLGAAQVIGLASSQAKRDQVRQLGADTAIDYTQLDWAEQVRAATNGAGVDVFLDASGDNEHGGLKPLARGGHWVIYGAQSDAPAGLSGGDLVGMIFGGQTIRGYSLYEMAPPQMADALDKLITWTVAGRLHVIADARFPLAQAADAHRAIEERKTTGKVVLVA